MCIRDRLWNVVLPQLKPATLIAIVVTIVGALRSFDLIAVMTAGGPWGSSEVLAYKMYQESLFNYRMGYGAAIATILFLIMDIYIAWFLYRLLKMKGQKNNVSNSYSELFSKSKYWLQTFAFIYPYSLAFTTSSCDDDFYENF